MSQPWTNLRKKVAQFSEELLAHRCGILDGVFVGERFVFCSKSVHSTTPQVSRDLGTTGKPCTFLPEHQMLSDPLKLWFCRHQTFGTEGMTRKFAKEAEGIISTSSTTRQSPEPRWPRVGQIFPYPAPKVFSEIVATQPKIHTGV